MSIRPEIKLLLSIGLIVFIIVFAFWLHGLALDNAYVQENIAQYGYFGIFVAAVISGLNLIVPIPAVSFVPALLESGLNYWVCIVILALGMTIADLVAYFFGRAGRRMFGHVFDQKWIKRMEVLKHKHPILPLGFVFLFASLIPFPNEIIVAPMGFLRYKIVYLVPVVFLGNLVFNFIFSKGLLELFKIFA